MLGDVTDPSLIRTLGGEVTLDQIVTDRRPWALGSAGFPGEAGPDLFLLAEPLDPVLTHVPTSSFEFVSDEAERQTLNQNGQSTRGQSQTTYHRRRKQRRLGKLTPIEFETIHNTALQAA